MGSFMQKGSVEGWEPHWTADSNFIVRKIGQQLLAYSRAEPTKGYLKFFFVFIILVFSCSYGESRGVNKSCCGTRSTTI